MSFADYTARLWHQCFLQPCDRLLQEWVLVTDKESTCHKRYYCGNTSSSHNAVLEIANLWFSWIGWWRWAAQRDSQGKILSIGVWLWKTVYNAVLNAKFALLIGQSGARIPKWSCFSYTKIQWAPPFCGCPDWKVACHMCDDPADWTYLTVRLKLTVYFNFLFTHVVALCFIFRLVKRELHSV